MTWWAGQWACFSWWQPWACPLGQPAVSTCASIRCTLQPPRPPTPRAKTGQKNSVGTLQTTTGCVVPEQEPPSVVAFVFSLSDLLDCCSECVVVINFYFHGSNHKRKWAGRTARENELDRGEPFRVANPVNLDFIRFAGNSHRPFGFQLRGRGMDRLALGSPFQAGRHGCCLFMSCLSGLHCMKDLSPVCHLSTSPWQQAQPKAGTKLPGSVPALFSATITCGSGKGTKTERSGNY